VTEGSARRSGPICKPRGPRLAGATTLSLYSCCGLARPPTIDFDQWANRPSQPASVPVLDRLLRFLGGGRMGHDLAGDLSQTAQPPCSRVTLYRMHY
jgi:hypothetical protein